MQPRHEPGLFLGNTARIGIAAACLSLLLGCVHLWSPIDPELGLCFNEPIGPETTPRPAGRPHHVDTLVVENIPGRQGHHGATVIALPNGDLLAAWYSAAGPNELDGAAIFLARRPAHATQWEAPYPLPDATTRSANPVLHRAGDEIWLFYASVPILGWSNARIEQRISTDGGGTWSESFSVCAITGANVRYPPVEMGPDGWLLGAYDDLWKSSLFLHSPDGRTWSLRASLSTGSEPACIQPSVVRLSTGRLLAVMRNAGGTWLWVTASADQGRTWSAPRDSGLPNPSSATALVRGEDGTLFLIYNDSRTARSHLTVAWSPDEGCTWPARRLLRPAEEINAYPSAIGAADGMVHVVFTRGLEHEAIVHAEFNAAWIASAP